MTKIHNEGIIISGGSVKADKLAVGQKAKIVSKTNEEIFASRRTEKLSIFLSYASEQREIAEQLYLTLSNSGHNVFFDREDIPVGSDFNAIILGKVRNCDLFVFLISPSSVANGAYTRSELKFAQDKWRSPQHHVLPVMAIPTALETIPNYLRSVNILKVEGSLPAEVAAIINSLSDK